MLQSLSSNNDSISKALLPLLLFIASFYAGSGAFLYYLTLWALLVLILFFTTQTKLSSGKLKIPAGTFNLICWLYLGWIILNYFFSQFKMMSFFSIWELGSLPITVLLWKLISDKENHWDVLSKFFLLFGLFSAGWGISDFFIVSDIDRLGINGQLLDPNTYAAMLNALFIPAALYYLRGPESLNKRLISLLYEVTFFTIMLVIFLTSSRAITLLLPALLTAGIIYLIKNRLISYNRLTKLLLILFAALITFKFIPTDEIGFQRTSYDSVLKPRLLMIQSALEIYKEYPLTGSGLGSYRAFYAGHRDANESTTSGDMTHNDYIQFLQEGGPIQLTFLLIFVSVGVWHLFRLFFTKTGTTTQNNQNAEKFALLLVVCGLSAHALINFIFYSLILSMLFGLYIARATDNYSLPTLKTISLPVRPWLAKSTLAILLLIPWSLLLADTVIMDAYNGYRLKPLIKLVQLDDSKERIKFSTISATIRPNNLLPRTDLLKYYQANLQHAKSINNHAKEKKISELMVQEFKSILSVCPIHAGIYKQWATMYMDSGDYNAAFEKLNKAISLERMSLDSYVLLAKTHALNMDYHSAMKVLFLDAKDWIDVSPQIKGDIFVLEAALEIAQQFNETDDVTHIAQMILDRDEENEKAAIAINGIAPEREHAIN